MSFSITTKRESTQAKKINTERMIKGSLEREFCREDERREIFLAEGRKVEKDNGRKNANFSSKSIDRNRRFFNTITTGYLSVVNFHERSALRGHFRNFQAREISPLQLYIVLIRVNIKRCNKMLAATQFSNRVHSRRKWKLMADEPKFLRSSK